MSVTVMFHVPMTARDGVTLYSDIYLPERTGKFPFIVLRSPYNSNDNVFCSYCAGFCEQGIGVVNQAVRGTAQSEGEFNISRQEAEDGEDFLNWLSAQEFCNGNIVSNGESYPGHTQWQMMRCAHPALKGITPHNGPLNFFHVAFRPGGAWGFGLGTFWAFGCRGRREKEELQGSWDTAKWHLPLLDMDTAGGFREWPVWRSWMEHVTYDDFWNKADAFKDLEKMTAPAFITGGWFDAFLPQTLAAFSAMRTRAATEKARKFTRCILEPLDHDMRTWEVDYGPDHLADIINVRGRFMKNILFDPENDPLPELPPMRFFVMGSNRWMDTDEWPLPQTEYTALYLCGAKANSVCGGGKLSFTAPDTDDIEENYLYNPLDPVPTTGGNNLGSIAPGQRAQNQLEKRSDILIFTGDELEEDLDVIGNVKARIYASTSAPDTDFTVKLCDVAPDGTSYNICDGLIRGRFRNGQEQEELLTPGEIYGFEIDLWSTAWTFKKGHRIRVHVSSSNFPRFDRNLNTGKHLTRDSEIALAHQRVYHGREHASCVILPVIPG